MSRRSTDDDHDPGADAAGARVAALETAAAEPIETGGSRVLVGTASWTDPTMTAAGVFYPTRRRQRRGAARLLRVVVPGRRGRRDLLRPAGRADRPAVGRADAAGLHVRHQGPRPDDRAGDRDAAPAEGDPRGAPGRAAGEDPDLRQGLPGRAERRGLAEFRSALAPLEERGQLGSILLQYPKWVFPSNENRALIEDAVERLDGWRVAVEFRNGSWLNEKNRDRTLGFLSERSIPFVMVDEPQGFKSSVPPEVAVTSPDLAIVRFHGRNAATWEAKNITPAERFRYLYSRDELSRVGSPDPRGGRGGEGGPPDVQQLLRQLRDDERPRDRRPPGRGAGERRLRLGVR